MTEARRNTCFRSSSRRSTRAMMTPCRLSGMVISATRSVARQRPEPRAPEPPRSIRLRITSSTKKGLPSVLRWIVWRRSAGSSTATRLADELGRLAAGEWTQENLDVPGRPSPRRQGSCKPLPRESPISGGPTRRQAGAHRRSAAARARRVRPRRRPASVRPRTPAPAGRSPARRLRRATPRGRAGAHPLDVLLANRRSASVAARVR